MRELNVELGLLLLISNTHPIITFVKTTTARIHISKKSKKKNDRESKSAMQSFIFNTSVIS